MKILRVSEEKDGFKLRFGSFLEAEALPFQMLITTVRVREAKSLTQALKKGAETARLNFKQMQKFNAEPQPVRGANATSSNYSV